MTTTALMFVSLYFLISKHVKNKHFSTDLKKNLNKMPQIILYSESRIANNRDAGIFILFD